MNVGIIGGADGPTAVLVAEPTPMQSFLTGLTVGVVVGVVITLAVFGIIHLVRKNKKK